MATLTVNGAKVQVDDSFLKLSPADQEKTVNEIAAQMGTRQPAPASQAQQPTAPPQSIGDQLSAGFTSGVNAIPIAGPTILGGLEGLKSGVQSMVYGPTTRAQVAARDQAQVQQNPVASTVGTVAGNVLPFAIGGEIPMAAKVLGMDSSVPLLIRSLASMGSGAAISGADTMARGGSPQQAVQDALSGGALGAAIPGVGTLLGKGANALGKRIAPIIDAMRNPEVAAQKMVSGTAARDIRSGQPVMTPANEASATINGQPIINADRFGQGIRSLARTAANSNPAADAALKDITEQRFLTQSARASDFIKRVAPGVDDLGALDKLQAQARVANSAAYGRAYAHPNAQVVWTPEIKQLFQSPDFISAIHGAERTAANDAAANGTKAVRSPFVFDAKGNIQVRTNPNGSKALPTLQFWDIVQRNLRAQSDQAFAGGNKLLGSQLTGLRGQLLNTLDSAVPAFQQARRGAAAAFGAEDALDAGRKFAMQKMAIPEATRAHATMSVPEKKLFATGFASEVIDKIGATSDRVNVINTVFGSPAARAQIELALGPRAAGQLEHFTRVEDIMQMTKHATQGNSTTAKQLAAMGALGGLGGGFLGGWDPRNIATGAGLMMAGRIGARALGKAVDQRVMQRVADILASHNPADINRTILNATLSPAHSAAIKAIEHGLAAITRGAVAGVTRPAPLQITVNGGTAPAY